MSKESRKPVYTEKPTHTTPPKKTRAQPTPEESLERLRNGAKYPNSMVDYYTILEAIDERGLYKEAFEIHERNYQQQMHMKDRLRLTEIKKLLAGEMI